MPPKSNQLVTTEVLGEVLDRVFPLTFEERIIYMHLHRMMLDRMAMNPKQFWCPTNLFNQAVKELELQDALFQASTEPEPKPEDSAKITLCKSQQNVV